MTVYLRCLKAIPNKKDWHYHGWQAEGQRAKLTSLGLCTVVDEIIITDELGGTAFRKPNKKTFLLMQTRLDTPFERMVYVGDNMVEDFAAQQALGMRCIWFQNGDGLYSKSP